MSAKQQLSGTSGMGEGYNANSRSQQAAGNLMTPLLELAVQHLCDNYSLRFKNEGATAVVCDYGCAHGGNSLKPISFIIEVLRKLTSEAQAVAVYHTDLPKNNYNTLFSTLLEDENTYLRLNNDSNVFYYATATSFYTQILPSNSVHLGFSANSLHWLTRVPSKIGCFFIPEASDEAKELWKTQAAIDWENFVKARASELAPGGSLVITSPARTAEGRNSSLFVPFFDRALNRMVKEGILPTEALNEINIPVYGRIFEEWTEPLEKYGLTLKNFHVHEVGDPMYERFKQTKNVEEYGTGMANWAKQWLNDILVHGFEILKVTDVQLAATTYYKYLAEDVSSCPTQFFLINAYFLVQKKI